MLRPYGKFPVISQKAYISLGSLAELETQLLLAVDLGFIDNNDLDESVQKIRRMLVGLIKSLK